MRARLLVLTVLAGCEPRPSAPYVPASSAVLPDLPAPAPEAMTPTATTAPPIAKVVDRDAVVRELSGRKPAAWGMHVDGVVDTFETTERKIALTFDACGGPGGDDFDEKLVETLERHGARPTLFISKRWAEDRPSTVRRLARAGFEIASHGDEHRPCSVTGRTAYNVRGTRNLGEALREIDDSSAFLAGLAGKPVRFFRPGTAHFDDVCADLAARLGRLPIGFSINGDSGAGASRGAVRKAIVEAKPGSIVLMHMNHPEGQTAEGVRDALGELDRAGTKVVALGDVLPASAARSAGK